jgi:hypothetical protein
MAVRTPAHRSRMMLTARRKVQIFGLDFGFVTFLHPVISEEHRKLRRPGG